MSKVVSDGQRVYQYDPDLAQVTVRNVKDSVGASPASIYLVMIIWILTLVLRSYLSVMVWCG